MSAFLTTCPFCSCGCGYYLITKNRQLNGVAPSERHPVSCGKLCARGWSAHEASLWGDRLKEPLLRQDGELKSASWPDAINHISGRLKAMIDAGKPVGVLGSSRATNEENYLAGKLGRAGLHTNNVDFSYHSICRPFFVGLEEVCGDHIPATSLNDISASQTIFLVEGNLAETHPRAASSVISAVEKGARLITTGYRMTQMARLSSLHLPSMPGNEEVIKGLLAAVLDLPLQGSILKAFPRKRYEALWRDLQNVERTDQLRQAAEWIARAERTTFLLPCTLGQDDQTRKYATAVATLAAINRHPRGAGLGLLPLFARSNVRGACDMGVVSDRLPGYDRLDNERARQRLQNLWGKKVSADPGWNSENLLQSVSGLIVVADDPPSVLPMGKRVMAAMEKIEFLVVLDSFLTPTVQMAHVVLPVASFAETEGTLSNMEGRVQRLRVAASPPAKARPAWQVLAELCARFDLDNSYTSATDIFSEIAQAAPPYAGIEQQLSEDSWGDAILEDSHQAEFTVHSIGAAGAATEASADRTHLLVRDGDFDWGGDPLVSFSPTLSRVYQSEHKLFPDGLVEISDRDVDALNLGSGRRVRLTSVHGAVVVSIRVRTDLRPGVLSVSYAFRNQLAGVLGTDSVTAVNVERP